MSRGRQGGGDRGAHEGRRAWCCHGHGHEPRDEAPYEVLTRREAGANTSEARADLERPDKVQPDHEDEPCDESHEGRRLELKAPSEPGTCGTQAFERAADNQHRDDNARGIGQCLRADGGPCFTAELRHAHRLDGEHRKHTRHQVEQQAAQQRAER